MGKIKSFWKIISHGHTAYGLFLLIIGSKLIVGIIAFTIASITSALSHFSPAGWFLTILFGLVGALILRNVFEEKRIKRLLPQVNPDDEAGQKMDTLLWLKEVLETDRSLLDTRIVAYITGNWDYSGIKDGKTECYIDVIINIENWAVFPITINGVKGSLQIDGELCTADISMKNSSTFNRGDNGNIRIKQPINKATADMLRGKRDSSTTTRNSINVDFSQCHLIIKSDEPDSSMLTVDKIMSCTKKIKIQCVVSCLYVIFS